MAQSISQRLNAAGFSDGQVRELRALFEAVVDEVTALKAATVGLAAKLDDDGTVTDTNYEALWTPSTGNLID